MLPLYSLMLFTARLIAISSALWWLATRILIEQVPRPLIRHLGAICLFAVLCGFLLDALIVYPRYRSILRKLPTVRLPSGNDFILMTEMPRGATPLRWITENPKADILNVKGFSLMPETILPVSPAALRDLMSTYAYDFEKPSSMRHFLAGIIGYGLITTEGKVHQRQRKALNPSFNIKHIRALYPAMWEESGTLLAEMQKDQERHSFIEITDWASRLALDIIGRTTLSRNFCSLITSEHPVAQSFATILDPEPHMIRFLCLNLILPQWITRLIPVAARNIIRHESAYLRSFCTELLIDQQSNLRQRAEERSQANYRGPLHEQEHTILTNLIETGEFTNKELVDQMLTLLAAGHETTGSSISWAIHLLTLPENQHYQSIIREEIRQGIPTSQLHPQQEVSFKAADCPPWSKFESFPYLNGLCEEILRLFPAIPTTFRESVRDTTLSGQPIPKGTFLLVAPWAINRNPHFWGPDADCLRPERWIEKLPDGSCRAQKHGGVESNYCEITFLHGQRACIGRDFAKVELRCVLAAILGRFELRRLEGDDGHVLISGAVTTKPRGGLKVQLRRIDGW